MKQCESGEFQQNKGDWLLWGVFDFFVFIHSGVKTKKGRLSLPSYQFLVD